METSDEWEVGRLYLNLEARWFYSIEPLLWNNLIDFTGKNSHNRGKMLKFNEFCHNNYHYGLKLFTKIYIKHRIHVIINSKPKGRSLLKIQPLSLLPLVTIIVISILLTSCTPAEIIKTPTLIPQSEEVSTSDPDQVKPPIIIQPTIESEPVVTAPVFDLGSISSVVLALTYAIETGDTNLMSSLSADTVSYSMYIEGGDPESKERFLNDFQDRYASHPTCDGVMINDNNTDTFIIFYSNWSPQWVVTRTCFVECNSLDKPWESAITGFVFMRSESGYKLSYVYLNTSKHLEYNWPNPMKPCPNPNEGLQPFASTGIDQSGACPGAPALRMTVGKDGSVCTKEDSMAVRKEPNRLGEMVIRLTPGTIFTVIGGPECSNNWSWWKIQTTNGTTGWIAEGGDDTDPYFICPVD